MKSILLACVANGRTRGDQMHSAKNQPPLNSKRIKTVNDIKIILHTTKGDIEGTIFASKVP